MPSAELSVTFSGILKAILSAGAGTWRAPVTIGERMANISQRLANTIGMARAFSGVHTTIFAFCWAASLPAGRQSFVSRRIRRRSEAAPLGLLSPRKGPPFYCLLLFD